MEKRRGNNWLMGAGGVLDCDNRFVEQSGDVKYYGGAYDYNKEDVLNCENEEVIYLGFMKDHWGIFLSDVTRRLYYYFKDSNKKIAFIGFGFEKGTFGKIDNQVKEFFEILGIEKDKIIDIRKPTKFKRIYVPEFGFWFEAKIYQEYLTPFKIACKNTNLISVSKKIYLSRTLFASNKEVGEKYIERFFKNNGFQIMYPEQLTVSEQIAAVSNADVIASVEGTIAHNILFARPQTKQIIIRKQSWLNPRQCLFNQVTDTHITYVDCYKEIYKGFPLNYDEGPFFISISKPFRVFAKENGYHLTGAWYLENLFSFVKYSKLCLKKLFWKKYKQMRRKIKSK